LAATLLRTEDLRRRFGGLNAVDGVSIDLAAGELHAVIGPNGAGKSTLINLLSGDLAPSSGAIYIDNRDVAGLPSWQLARLGIGRSYQRTNIFKQLSVLENVVLAVQARTVVLREMLRSAWRRPDLMERARAVLSRAGLDGVDERRAAAELSHGEQRQLEIAMTLAVEPRLLLLDEPLAGIGPEESERLVPLLRSLADDHGVLLVEHDMDVVFSIADRITVMVNGRVLAQGDPAAMRADAAVREAYLGDEA
jgi:branched-chain amino acid transport system ATP-binding protein